MKKGLKFLSSEKEGLQERTNAAEDFLKKINVKFLAYEKVDSYFSWSGKPPGL